MASYGVGGHVKLPGPNAKSPNTYKFGTPYQTIYDDLMAKDPALYTRNGLLKMVKRNIGVKHAPERWQNSLTQHDVVLTFEEWVFDKVNCLPTTALPPIWLQIVFIPSLSAWCKACTLKRCQDVKLPRHMCANTKANQQLS